MKPTCFNSLPYVESDFGTTDKLSQNLSPLSYIIGTLELHVPSRRKKSLQSYLSVDLNFPALMRFDMTFDVTLRDDSSFG